MAITSREQLKAWFRKGLKPLESQFAAWLDSYWHKSDSIPMSSIDGLNDALNDRTVIADNTLDTTSTNPIQNAPVATALEGKSDVGHTHSQYLTEHQDISGKQDNTDNSLLTIAKTIVGAINELLNKFQDYLKGIQSVTHAELKNLRDTNKLSAGQWYRITDYLTMVANDTEARSAGHPFDLLVVATSPNTLSEEARAIKSSRDTDDYFADVNLSAWKVWYCLDNDATRFAWADTENGKGVIWRMVDEWQNDCPYDFKNVQFKRYLASTSSAVLTDSINGKYYAYNGEMNNVEIADEENFVWAYTFTLIDEDEQWVDYSVRAEGVLGEEPELTWGYLHQFKNGKCEYNHIRNVYAAVAIDDEQYRALTLNNIVLISTISEELGLPEEMQLNEFGSGNYNMTLKDNPEQNHFGNKCYNNIVGTFGNTFGNSCGGNTFGNNCDYNTFGNSCWYNTFGNDCDYNTFGNSCGGNTFGNDCDSNTFGNGCVYNTFGNYVRQLTVFEGVQYVSVTGGNNISAYVQNAQILNGTHGSVSPNELQISFQPNVNYCQFAGLKSDGNLRIWTPADGA